MRRSFGLPPIQCWPLVALLSLAINLNGSVAQAAAPDDAQTPWAVRVNGSRLIYLVEHSSIAVPMAPGFLPGESHHVPYLADARLRCTCYFDTMPLPAGVATTQPSADTVPDASQLLPVRRLKYTIARDSPITQSPEPGFAYLVRFTALNQIPEAGPAMECARVVGDRLLIGCVLCEHDDAASTAGAERYLLAMMKSATVTTRRPVGANHYEQGSAFTREAAAAFIKRTSQGAPDDSPPDNEPRVVSQQLPPATSQTKTPVSTAGTASPTTTAPSSEPPAVAPPADPAVKAASALTMAENYLAAGRTDIARTKLQAIIDKYPNTPAAQKAKDHVADLDRAGK